MVKKDKEATVKSSKKDDPTNKTERAKSPGRPKSPGRSKSPARSKSPGRTKKVKTPPRSPSRRSPIRKTTPVKATGNKSPSRKSPSRAKNLVKSSERSKLPVAASTVSSRPTKIPLVDLDSDSGDDGIKYEKPKATVKGRSRNYDIEIDPPKVVDHIRSDLDNISSSIGQVLRRSSRRSQSRDEERIIHLREKPIKKLIELSDDDDVYVNRPPSKRPSEAKSVPDRSTSLEYGGWIGALLLTLIYPVVFIAFGIVCNESQCSFKQLPKLDKYFLLSSYLDNTSAILYGSYFLLIALVSLLPFGGKKASAPPNKQGKLDYVLNGFFASLVVIGTVFGIDHFKMRIIPSIMEKTFTLLVASLTVALLLSIYVYGRSFFIPVSALNPFGVTNSRIYNFWIGREINPRVFNKLDLKMTTARSYFIGVLLLNLLYIYNNLTVSKFSPTLAVISALQIIYALEHLIFEEQLLTTFEWMYEGYGYNEIVGLCAGMFMTTAIPRYIYEFDVKLPYWHLAAAATAFCIGYFLYHASNHQKHAFRRNPYSPSFSGFESIPTSQGKKILVSGYWGVVRKPNVVGDVLMNLSWLSFAWWTPLGLICIANIIYLIHRTVRDDSRCKQRYGSAWDRYCQKVKYILVPKVY